MVFVELCPYASPRYRLQLLLPQLRDDVGFQISADVLSLLLDRAQPALVLVNGGDAVGAFVERAGPRLVWEERHYESSSSSRTKRLHHWQGWYSSGTYRIPVGGFPFLRTPGSHNSNAELGQLGQQLHQLVVGDPDAR